MALLNYLFQRARLMTIMAILAGFGSGLSSAALIAAISRQLTQQAPIAPLFIAAFAALLLFVLITDLAAKWLLMRLSAGITYTLRLELARRILSTPLRQLEVIGNPTLIGALVEDIRVVSLALHQLPSVCIGLTVILGCATYLAWLSPTLFALLTLLALPTLAIHRYLHRQAKSTLRELLAVRDQRDQHFAGLTQGVKELQLNEQRRQAFITQLLEPTLQLMRQQLVSTRLYHALAQSWSQSTYFVFILLILSLTYWAGMELTLLTSYAVTALYMKNAINQILSAIPQWSEATLAFQKIEQLQLSAPTTATDEEAPVDFAVAGDFQLSLSGITHAYSNDLSNEPFILGPLDLHFSAGELIFITGANGSGKTTLMKILAGLYAPESGAITLADTPVTAQNRQWYREHFSVVFSDFYLFEQLLGMEELTVDEQAWAYLTKLHLQHKVTVHQRRLSTLDLSTGQRKRLALLTAYLEDRPIYLFDEWAANQDPAFKDLFYRELLPELVARGKLVIAITHDHQYFAVADRLLHLEAGRLVGETDLPTSFLPISIPTLGVVQN